MSTTTARNWHKQRRKLVSATLKRIPNVFGFLNPELLNPDLGTGFGIYKSRGIGIGILLVTST
jgi:hypothetical protein